MGYSIGPKIGIDGEAEFRNELRRINDTYKALEAETRAVSAAFEAQGDEQGKLTAQSKQLEKQIETQKKKIDLLSDAVSKATVKYGEDSIEAIRLRGALYDTEATIAGLESELGVTRQRLIETAAGMDEAALEAERLTQVESELEGQIQDLDSEYKVLNAQTKALTAEQRNNGNEQESLIIQSQQLEKQIDNQQKKIQLLEKAVDNASAKYGENSSEANKLRVSLYDTKTTVSKLESELSDTNQKLENMADGLEEVSEEADDAGDSILDFGDILNANLAADAIKDGLEKLGDVVVDFAKGSLDAASDVNAATSQFEQAFGDMESTARSALESISDETGIAVTRMQGDYTKLYAFTKAAGADTETAMDIAGRAMAAAADNAAYYDKSVEEAVEQLQSFIKGNYENDAALGISATETTRNAKANELYAMSFQELSEAQKVDVLLSMVEAGNAASGALGQAAREAASWTNVTDELDEALVQLQATIGQPVLEMAIPVIQKITECIYDLIEVSDWQKLDDGIKSFTSSMESADEQFQATTKDIESTAYAAEWYVNRLEELEQAGLDTADAQNEYAAVVKELNSLIPDLNLTIGEQTGLVGQNKSVIRQNIQAWEDLATAQALQEKANAQIKAQADAEADLYTAKARLTVLQEEQTYLEQQLAEATNGATQEERELYHALEDSSRAFLTADYALSGFILSMGDTNDEAAQLEKQIEENRAEMAGLNNSIAAGEETLADYEAELGEAKTALALYQSEASEAAASQSTLEGKVREVDNAIAELETAYADVKEAARVSIDSQIGLFDELSTEASMSTKEIIENWRKQQAAFNNYAANLQKAVDMGLDQTLVEQLSDGTEQSMLVLDQLVNDTEISVDEINAAFRDNLKARDLMSDAIAEVRTGANAQIDALKKDAATWGYDIVKGAADGVDANAYLFSNSMRWMASGGKKAFRETWVINSPSRVMIETSESIVEGAVTGIDVNVDKFEAVMANLANAGETAFLGERLASAASYADWMGLPGETTYGGTNNSTSFGNFVFNVCQQPGESSDELYDRMMDRVQTDLLKKGVSLSVNG